MAKTSPAQQKAVHKYVKNNYDRLELSVPKGEKEKIKKAAIAAGQSVNNYIYSRLPQNGTRCPRRGGKN